MLSIARNIIANGFYLFLLKIFLNVFFQLSPSNRAESVVALMVRKMPIGNIIIDESQTPKKIGMSPAIAIR